MKALKKALLLFLAVSVVVGSSYSTGWALDTSWNENDPMTDGWNMIDVVVARPFGIAAAILGSAVFIVSLPFTIPTGSVSNAADMFIVNPLRISIDRKFPDEEM